MWLPTQNSKVLILGTPSYSLILSTPHTWPSLGKHFSAGRVICHLDTIWGTKGFWVMPFPGKELLESLDYSKCSKSILMPMSLLLEDRPLASHLYNLGIWHEHGSWEIYLYLVQQYHPTPAVSQKMSPLLGQVSYFVHHPTLSPAWLRNGLDEQSEKLFNSNC